MLVYYYHKVSASLVVPRLANAVGSLPHNLPNAVGSSAALYRLTNAVGSLTMAFARTCTQCHARNQSTTITHLHIALLLCLPLSYSDDAFGIQLSQCTDIVGLLVTAVTVARR